MSVETVVQLIITSIVIVGFVSVVVGASAQQKQAVALLDQFRQAMKAADFAPEVIHLFRRSGIAMRAGEERVFFLCDGVPVPLRRHDVVDVRRVEQTSEELVVKHSGATSKARARVVDQVGRIEVSTRDLMRPLIVVHFPAPQKAAEWEARLQSWRSA